LLSSAHYVELALITGLSRIPPPPLHLMTEKDSFAEILCMLNVPQTVDSVQNNIHVMTFMPCQSHANTHARGYFVSTPPPTRVSCREGVPTKCFRET
jgi:hypothetical protein